MNADWLRTQVLVAERMSTRTQRLAFWGSWCFHQSFAWKLEHRVTTIHCSVMFLPSIPFIGGTGFALKSGDPSTNVNWSFGEGGGGRWTDVCHRRSSPWTVFVSPFFWKTKTVSPSLASDVEVLPLPPTRQGLWKRHPPRGHPWRHGWRGDRRDPFGVGETVGAQEPRVFRWWRIQLRLKKPSSTIP